MEDIRVLVDYILEFEGEDFDQNRHDQLPLEGVTSSEWEKALSDYDNVRAGKTDSQTSEKEAFDLLAVKCGTHVYGSAARLWHRHFKQT